MILPQASKPTSELKELRDEFIRLTNEYKASLTNLLPFNEREVQRAEERLALSRKLLAEGMIPGSQVEDNERLLVEAKRKLQETKDQMANADQQMAGVLDEAKLEAEYKQAVRLRRKARKPRCTSWTMTATQRTTQNSVSYFYKFVCLN